MSFGKPKKRFSQNFLIDKDTSQKIVDLLDIRQNDTIFEIGPGRGALTGIIARYDINLFAFEIDSSLAGKLSSDLEPFENVKIINADFLKVQPKEYCPGRFKLIGNIPYDITSPLIEWINQRKDSIDLAVITAQKELAARIASPPNSKDWAPISIFTQCFFDIIIAFNIPPEAFYPQPKVLSSTLILKPSQKYDIKKWKNFETIVRQAFVHRRKLLVKNLSLLPGIDKEELLTTLKDMGIDRKVRAEQLSINDFINLSNNISLKIS